MKSKDFLANLDISELERIELSQIIYSLEVRKDHYKNIIHNLSNGIIVVNSNGKIIDYNTGFLDLFNFQQEDCKELMFVDLIYSNPNVYWDILSDEVLKSKKPMKFEIVGKNINGILVNLELNANPIYQQDKPCLLIELKNINKRKKVENLLIESEDRYRNISEAMFDTMIIVSGGKMIKASENFAQMWGYNDISEMKGISINELMGENIANLITAKIQLGVDEIVEFPAIRKDGTQFYCQSLMKNYEYKGQNTTLMAIRDITEQKRMQEALIESEEIFRSIVQNSPNILLSINPDFSIFYANHQFTRLVKGPVDKYIGKFIHELPLEKYFIQRLIEGIENVFQTKELQITEVIKIRRMELYAQLVPIIINDEIRQIMIIFTDITEQIVAQQQLKSINQDSEKRYEKLFNSFLKPSLIVTNNIIEQVNQTFVNKFEFNNKNDVLRKHLMHILPFDFKSGNSKLTNRSMFQKNETIRYETKLLDGNNVTIPVYLNISIFDDGENNSYIISIRDLRQIKEHERNTSEMLEVKLKLEKLESLKKLAGGVAHDFNNLLTSIMCNASLAQSEIENTELLKDILQEIIEFGTQAAEISHKMLAFSGSGRIDTVVENINTVIIELLDDIKKSLPSKCQIHTMSTQSLLLVKIDRDQLTLVCRNLVVNAIEAIKNKQSTEKGYISIHTGLVESINKYEYLIIPRSRKQKYAFIKIKDNGIGIKYDEIDRIFDPFFSTQAIGRGLGLSVVLGILQSYNGTIGIESELGMGTTITLYLPVNDKQGQSTMQAGKSSAKGVILVCDDEPAIRKTLKRYLTRNGFNVMTANNGKEALSIITSQKYNIDVLLLDSVMPELDGPQLLEILNRRKSKIPIIMMSGYIIEDFSRETYKDLEIIDFISKPFSIKKLINSIKEICESV